MLESDHLGQAGHSISYCSWKLPFLHSKHSGAPHASVLSQSLSEDTAADRLSYSARFADGYRDGEFCGEAPSLVRLGTVNLHLSWHLPVA